VLPERFLQRTERIIARRQALNGHDFGIGGLYRKHQTRADGISVYNHSAGTTHAVFARKMRPGLSKLMPQTVG
jgi:hypothetical protein